MLWKKWNNGFVSITILLILIVVPLFIKSQYIIHLFILTFLSIIYAVSLRIVMRNGLLSFGHGAFVGIGAYCSALLMMKLGLPFLLSLLLAGVITALIGGLILFPALRVKGAYFVILTWAMGEVFVAVYKRGKTLFGGIKGLYGIPKPEIFGMQFTDKIDFFYLTLVLMVITLLVSYRIDRTQFGIVIKGIADSSDLSESVGINLPKYKVLNFSIACLFAGWGGGILAFYLGFLEPGMFGIALSESIVAYMLIGGAGNIIGTIIGATLLTILPEILAFASHFKMMFYGILLLLTMIFMPAGLVSLPSLLKKKKIPAKLS